MCVCKGERAHLCPHERLPPSNSLLPDRARSITAATAKTGLRVPPHSKRAWHRITMARRSVLPQLKSEQL
eukprot:scaffold89850_cov17-Tisochrysis_lutea.AAC.1